MTELGTQYHKPLFDLIPEARRAAIIQAAEQEFALKGYASATMGAIAERAGVSVGSLYQYFPHKEGLYLALVHRGFELLDQALGPILAMPMGLEERIRAIIDAIYAHSHHNRTMTRLYNRFTTEGNPSLTSVVAANLETFTARHYAMLIAQAREEGLITSPVNERILAFCMDSIFLVLQFSLTGDYYRDRMKIYLGPDLSTDPATVKEGLVCFITAALGITPRKEP